jgi:hypothetical protein
VVNSVLLLAIAALAPWTIHLAPPRQRLYALGGVVVVFVLYGIFAQNPLTTWEMWAGLGVGILSILLVTAAGARAGGASSRGHSARGRGGRGRSGDVDDPGATGEVP